MTTAQVVLVPAVLLVLNIARVVACPRDFSLLFAFPLYLVAWWIASWTLMLSAQQIALPLLLAGLGCVTLLHALTHTLVAVFIAPALRAHRRRGLAAPVQAVPAARSHLAVMKAAPRGVETHQASSRERS